MLSAAVAVPSYGLVIQASLLARRTKSRQINFGDWRKTRMGASKLKTRNQSPLRWDSSCLRHIDVPPCRSNGKHASGNRCEYARVHSSLNTGDTKSHDRDEQSTEKEPERPDVDAWPNIHQFQPWRATFRREMSSASARQHDAMHWVMDVDDGIHWKFCALTLLCLAIRTRTYTRCEAGKRIDEHLLWQVQWQSCIRRTQGSIMASKVAEWTTDCFQDVRPLQA